MTNEIPGIAASNGIAIGKAFLLEKLELTIEKNVISNTDAEVLRFEQALKKSKEELKRIKEHTRYEIGEEEAAIFEAHLLVLNDPELLNPIKEKITDEQLNAEYALNQVAMMFISMFEAMDNEYMKERATDIRDVTKRVLSHLLNVSVSDPSLIAEEVIVIADDLTPSDTAQLNRQFVKGFSTNIGGRTSHSAIMARSLEIPAVVGTKTITETIKNGDMLIVDGFNGKVIINPSTEIVESYQEKKAACELQKGEWAKLVHKQTVTACGQYVKLGANIGTPDDISAVLENGAEAIGLYRTEFLYMGRETLPTEEEQFQAYKAVLHSMNGKSVVVRTLDIGGDKELPYLEMPKEINPFLGFRAIRLCLEAQDIFRTQLKALLRASIYGNLKIMFPMIATLEEFRQAKAILLDEKMKLVRKGVEVSNNIEVGMMVEVPSTAVMADLFAKEVDFFSIGTNDLIQYTMAADRMNERVSYLYQPYNPAILRLVKNVIDAAHKDGKWVGMCGEMAGDEIAIPILLALGLDEFSMSAASILKARSQISRLSKSVIENHIKFILSMSTADEVYHYIKNSFV
ncbi:phosphoenolpyruvate--protein phosphotransferase [Bacillus sp. DTU_2020_1000418_1_SI_GHA_SEK_038]|uniref:phosphoenolpyruvate--protein phosphotransferase n=1 Tax=Bacillus sp. DTU_2020_1000418_1_SI_GHA_SEK_038 TaxID=3077585 RepID=UPI0028EDAD0F|nr:phosphoenolpyruvate--protein phosphotransferase [Bacillus sp. DTU_2020_1000418_1_SI_GHA_SEK_038]WNS77636.1 phosphoenolpyruvate--protein phosphotransferase [Bacillus sp. DTU_2020_1000418_1_SI_GHA_SEK_038]